MNNIYIYINGMWWYGHVMRKPDEYMTKKVLELESGPKSRGRPRLTWMSIIKKVLDKDNIDPWTTLKRHLWRRLIRSADPK